jgi:hypothetical protein
MTAPIRVITPVDRISRSLLSALDGRVQIAPISNQNPQFDIDAAYRVTAEIRSLRATGGERVLGRIGRHPLFKMLELHYTRRARGQRRDDSSHTGGPSVSYSSGAVLWGAP